MTESAQFNATTQHLSNYFEIFFWIVFGVTIVFGLLVLLLRMREVSLQAISKAAIQNILFSSVVVGQFFLLLAVCYLFWFNYYNPAPVIQFPGDVLADTYWVKDDLEIYFIDENRLQSVEINGRNKRDVLAAADPVKEYHFSPDGEYLLVATSREIYLIDRDTGQKQLIDSWGQPDAVGEWEGVISGIRWAPDSRRFCYEVARWSSYSSQNHLYIYDVQEKQKRTFQSPTRRISSLYWDRAGLNLYYVEREAKDTSVHAYAFDVNVFRIPLASLRPEFVAKIPYDRSGIPTANLTVRGIDLSLEGNVFSFSQGTARDILVSDKGKVLGMDDDDHLYYVHGEWFRRRLFRIQREARPSDIARHAYRGGDLTITQIRWIPGGRYAIIHHRYLGLLVVEPATRKIGLLIAAKGNAFGWYDKNFSVYAGTHPTQ